MNKIAFRNRLVKLRKENHLTQPTFATQLSRFMGRETQFSPSTISSWELGTKEPSFDTLIAIADYFGVSADYLLGRPVDNGTFDRKPFYLDDYIVEITPENLPRYIGKPVFIVFTSDSSLNQWGVYNGEKDCFCCQKHVYQNSPSMMKYYAAPQESLPTYKSVEQRLDMTDLMETKVFWIEYFAGGSMNRERYSGWYHHCKDELSIINDSGFILPYSGLNVNYYAYKTKI